MFVKDIGAPISLLLSEMSEIKHAEGREVVRLSHGTSQPVRPPMASMQAGMLRSILGGLPVHRQELLTGLRAAS